MGGPAVFREPTIVASCRGVVAGVPAMWGVLAEVAIHRGLAG